MKYQDYKRKAASKAPGTPSKYAKEDDVEYSIGLKEEWDKLIDEIEIVGETYTSLKYQIEGA